MEASAFRFSSIGRHIEHHQPHTQDLPRPLALQHGIHQQDAAQPLALLSPIDSEVTEKNAWDQVRARCLRGSIGWHVGCADGMGIDGVKAQAGPRFVCLGSVGGDVEPGVVITLLALRGAAQKIVLAVAAAAELPGVVPTRVKGLDPNRLAPDQGRTT
ncbi:MAG: hypothetical protein EA413_01030 [Cyanobium sp. PLM2.Bin73]|nr:MAG: hypothetical protein EA413_01030 [Cyanobium sp. PLM2.Bin73]